MPAPAHGTAILVLEDGRTFTGESYGADGETFGEAVFNTGMTVTDTVVREAPKVGRNDPCPCGSGKKYKQCHGAN